MSYKERLIERILKIDKGETKTHCKRIPIKILESWIPMYARYNPAIDRHLFDMTTI